MTKMSSTRTLKVLAAARKLIEKGWTKHEPARDAEGNRVSPKSKEAVRWCAIGALDAVTRNINPAWDALTLALPARGPLTVIDFNNEASSKRMVLQLFDRAMARLI